MGVEYSYYAEDRHVYFDMGKWYCWDRWQNDTMSDKTAVDKLYLPREELIDLLDAYCKHFDMTPAEKRDYATWLADRLLEFRASTLPGNMRWVNDSDDSDSVLSTCRRCSQEWICQGDTCACLPLTPDIAKCIGSRYRGDNGEMLYVEDDAP